jgi:hypothetical protein
MEDKMSNCGLCSRREKETRPTTEHLFEDFKSDILNGTALKSQTKWSAFGNLAVKVEVELDNLMNWLRKASFKLRIHFKINISCFVQPILLNLAPNDQLSL